MSMSLKQDKHSSIVIYRVEKHLNNTAVAGILMQSIWDTVKEINVEKLRISNFLVVYSLDNVKMECDENLHF